MTLSGTIGVLTFHRCVNYGSYWQARCLVEGLRIRGIDAVLLDHHSPRVNRAEWRCALSPHLPALTRRADRRAYARKTRRFLAAFDRLPLSPPFSLEAPGDAPACALVLVGSDEVWNLRHPWYGGCELFYGRDLPGRRLASYAASFGNHAARDGLDPRFARLLGRFEALSVRDDNSLDLIRAAVGRDAALVLDPCLQFPEVARAPGGGGSDYVLVYGHGFPDWFQAGVVAWARKAGLPLLSFGYRNDWADAHWLDAGPEDFPGAFAGAAAVATTFFHGCVFALLHDKPLLCAASDYRANKVRSLMRLLGAEHRLVGADADAAAFRAALDAAPGPKVARRVAALRRQSDAYLDHVLG